MQFSLKCEMCVDEWCLLLSYSLFNLIMLRILSVSLKVRSHLSSYDDIMVDEVVQGVQ